MSQRFSNNARSRLVGALNNSATTFTIESATADTFPVANTTNWVTPLNWFKATIQNSLGQVEIVRVGTRGLGSGIFGNVLRGQDGTTAIAFDAGAVVGLRVTAEDIEAALALLEENNTFSGDNNFSGDNTHSGQSDFTGEMRQNGAQVRTVPVGGIIMYDGLIADIPAGWQLCDGTNGTPDMRNRFVIGAMVDASGEAQTTITGAPTKTGGSKDAIVVAHAHGVNITSGNMSADHTHSGATASAGVHAHSVQYASGSNTGSSYPSRLSESGLTNVPTAADGAHSHSFTTGGSSANHSHPVIGNTASTGASGTNANLVPYYALAYIKCMPYV
jgi:hypothetical protein